MAKILLIGGIGAGKTSLKQMLLNEDVSYQKTQMLDFSRLFLDCPGEYLEIARRDIDDLKADIIGCWINMILFAPATAGAENQEGLIGNLVRQLDAKIKILVCQDRFLAVELEPSGADIR